MKYFDKVTSKYSICIDIFITTLYHISTTPKNLYLVTLWQHYDYMIS